MMADFQQLPHLTPIQHWWGEQHFALNERKVWQFGSLIVRLTRHLNEWRLEYYRPDVQHDVEQEYRVLSPETALPQPMKIERYMFRQTDERFYFMPQLSPRSVVIKPVDPVFIPAGQSTTLYISTPLWITGKTDLHHAALFELPVIRPKETWFGQSKQKGEICHVTSVDARTDLALLVPRAFRAVTPVRIQNNSLQQLHFERMSVPVTALPLYYSASTGRLLTSQIRVSYDGKEQSPRIRVEHRSPAFAGQVENIHAARENLPLFNMFESLF